MWPLYIYATLWLLEDTPALSFANWQPNDWAAGLLIACACALGLAIKREDV